VTASGDIDFREYLPIRARSSLGNCHGHPLPQTLNQPDNLDDANSEWLPVGDSLRLIGCEWSSVGHMNRERHPEQEAVEHAEGHGQRGHILDSPAMKHPIRHVRSRPNRHLLEHWVVPGPGHLGQRLHQGTHMRLEGPIARRQ